MRIFITGASGFVGGALTKHFARAGHTVLGMARSDSSEAAVRSSGGTAVRCDLSSIGASHLSSVDVVVHCAAFVREHGTDAEYFEANVTGTANVLRAAQDARVPRFIHIGTEAALFHGQDMSDVDESNPLAPTSPYPYPRTKAQAEALVVAANSPSLTTIVVRPRMIWGPGDTVILPALLRAVRQGKFRFIDGGRPRTSTCHIANLVSAVELALTKGGGGQAYFVVDDGTVTVREFMTALVATQGVDIGGGSVPSWVAQAVARVVEPLWGWMWPGSPPPLTRMIADFLSVNCTLSADKAKRELGYAPVISREEGLRAMPRVEAK